MKDELVDSLVVKNEKKIVFLVMDGLGGLPVDGKNKTELEAARTPNLDELARRGVCGLLDPIEPGITPGSGPAHFALFGYDPVKNNVGRGILGAAGLEFPMTEKDLFMRVNFCTIDAQGMIRDRRAGRIDTDTNRRLCGLLRDKVRLPEGIQAFFETEKEHRALFVLRGDGLREEIEETDPQKTGLPPLAPRALLPDAEGTAALLRLLVQQAQDILKNEPKANMVLLRGYSCFHKFPGVGERFGLRPLAIASYPMYRGIAKLLGMNVHKPTNTIREEFEALRGEFANHDFFFVHVKPTDSRGEDGQYEQKVRVIEEVDELLPLITELSPDVLVVTGDHSTPAALASHSWHPVPVLLTAKTCRPDRVERFGESDCLAGGLGRMPMKHLMAVALAHAGKLEKFGA